VSTGPAGTVTVDAGYNAADQPKEVTVGALGASWTTSATYAKTHQPVSMTALGQTWRFGYSAPGALTQVASGRALRTRSYDTAGRLAAVSAGYSTGAAYFTNLLRSDLAYDSRDRIAEVYTATRGVPGGVYFDTFSYDAASRLAGFARTGDGASTGSTFTYDAAGAMTSRTDAGVTTTFTVDADGRLTSSVSGSVVTTYTHDLYGRRTSAESTASATTYSWDAAGQLAGITTPGASATYAYGAGGMLESVSVTTPQGTTSTQSVWDGQTLLAECDSDGTLYRYVHGPDGSPLSLVRTRPGGPDERFNYHTDALGSVVAITSETGTVVATYRYGAFGEVLATGGSDAALASRNPLRYRAYYYDTHSALYYLPARYYDPASARFLSPDPAPASAGDPRTLDRYMYCMGDPVNYYDPSGAYLAAGGGASKVSDEAIALAKDDLAAAIAVQDAYRATVAASYASGLSYDAAHAAAEVAAAERAAALAERENVGEDAYSDPIAPSDLAPVIHAMYGPGTDLLAFGTVQLIGGIALAIAGFQVGVAGTVVIPATLGLGTGLTVAGGTAMLGGVHLAGAGAVLIWAGGVDNGWWGHE